MVLPDHFQRIAVRRVILIREQGDEFRYEELAHLLLQAQSCKCGVHPAGVLRGCVSAGEEEEGQNYSA